MPLIITRGLGEDDGVVVIRDIGNEFNAQLVVEDRFFGLLEVKDEEVPTGRIREPIQVQGTLVSEETFFGTVTTSTYYVGYLSDEECPKMEDQRIQMYLRDDRTLSLVINDHNDDPVDLTGAKVTFTVKEKMGDPDDQAVFQKKNTEAGGGPSEINVINPTGGSAEIYIVPADTEDVNPGNYMWDVQVTLANGKTYTVLRGRVTFKEDVTKATA
jgi:hypothetical protein